MPARRGAHLVRREPRDQQRLDGPESRRCVGGARGALRSTGFGAALFTINWFLSANRSSRIGSGVGNHIGDVSGRVFDAGAVIRSLPTAAAAGAAAAPVAAAAAAAVAAAAAAAAAVADQRQQQRSRSRAVYLRC